MTVLSPEMRAQLATRRRGVETIVAALRGTPGAPSIAHVRASTPEDRPPSGVTVTSVEMDGVPGLLHEPGEIEGGRVLLYMHGGGYVSGSPASYQDFCGRLALATRSRVYVPDYRLAPEHPFPAPIDDVLAAYRWLLKRHDAGLIAFAGDSAGGAMVVSVMVKARNAGLALPAAGVAVSPWANLEHTGASATSRDHLDPLVTRDDLTVMARAFLGGALPGDPDASPIRADVRGLPPILVQIGENEVMLSDAIRLAGHLGESRVRVSLEVWPGMFHVWPRFAAILPEGAQALRNAAVFLDSAPHPSWGVRR